MVMYHVWVPVPAPELAKGWCYQRKLVHAASGDDAVFAAIVDIASCAPDQIVSIVSGVPVVAAISMEPLTREQRDQLLLGYAP